VNGPLVLAHVLARPDLDWRPLELG